MQAETSADVRRLFELNRDYIRAVQTSDDRWFDKMLANDFRCSLPDGTLLDRKRFLERAVRPLDITQLEVHDVEIRVLGDAAIVHARTTFRTADGRAGSGRYTDVWCRQEGRWLAAAAHFTRQLE
jgi:ketosteroid isomerase-like protein